MRSIHALAPAKINWTLEVLGKRPDGYHEVLTVLQTAAPSDTITLHTSNDISLVVYRAARDFRHAPLENNLAYKAAILLKERTGFKGGAHIRLTKRIPIAAGLGGGSSDAAAVLRGLRSLWALDISDQDLALLAAELGSDVPFLLLGGCALASGRGERTVPLPDPPPISLTIAWPRHHSTAPDKTARMYRALRKEHYTDGSRTGRLAERIRQGSPIREDDLFNVFESVLAEVDPGGAALLEHASSLGFGRAHLCGSGPSFFFVSDRYLELCLTLQEAGLGFSSGLTLPFRERLDVTD